MLRFFRKYNKFILAVFGTGLMVVFLIEPAMQGCGRTQTDVPFGYIGDRALTRTDQVRAQGQLQALDSLSRLKGLPPSIFSGGDLLSWVLMIDEARAMGLSASNEEVNQLLIGFGIDDSDLKRVARTLQVSSEFVREAVRDWSMVQTYKTLVRGTVPVPIDDRARRYADRMIAGDPPLSTPLVERFIFGLRSTVKVSITVISHLQVQDEVEAPDEQTVRDLFEQHKDKLVGASEPHGFGYHLPDRVRVEYLACRAAGLSDAVEVTEREVLEYYKAHPDEFLDPAVDASATDPPDPAGAAKSSPPKRVMPYRQIRDRVRLAVRKYNARKLADRVMGFARRSLNEQIERFPMKEGIRQVPDNFEPLTLDQIRRMVDEEFGVDVTIHRDTGLWHSREQLSRMQGIGDAVVRLEGRSRRRRRSSVGFADYALSVPPLKPASSLHLGLNFPSRILETQDARFVFRVTATTAAASPTFDASRSDVVRDAEKLKAYEQLVAGKDGWVERARSTTLEALAEAHGTTVTESQMFPRREWFFGFQVPHVAGVGRDEAFVDRVFEAVTEDLGISTPGTDNGGPESVPAYIIAVPSPRTLSLILVRIEQFNPVPRSVYEQVAGSNELGLIVGLYLADNPQFDPLSIEAIKNRVGYKDAP